MKALRLLQNRWFLAAICLLLIGAVIWFIGPLFGFADRRPLEGELSRVVLIAAIVVVWLVVALIRESKRKQASDQIAEGIVQQRAASPGVKTGGDFGQLQARFDEAIAVLKKTRGRKGRLNLYDLPWYIIIGPPGSGKTTALVNSGLNFPLADRFGNEALRGVGGTRNCDWWFTDQAILIDTAGRYTTQDSDARSDSAEWLGFLDLLKRHRKRRPINGVLIAISIGDVLQLTPTEREQHVSAIRERVQELYDRCGVRVPIYVLLTKCDLLAGFTEFFEDLGRTEREQVWGMTFPVSRDGEVDLGGEFDAEFDALVARLNERVLDRMEHERDVTRRGLLYGFPAQVANVKPIVQAFIEDVFRGSRYESQPFVRGVYVTSGTQEGSPIDRLVGAVARNFGLSVEALPAFKGQGRSYFLTRLLTQVIFGEAELAGADRREEWRNKWGYRVAYAAIFGIATVLLIGWGISYVKNASLLASTSEYVDAASTPVGRLNARSDLFRDVLPALDRVRDIPTDTGVFFGLGIDQSEKLKEEADRTYRRLLVEQLLPRLMLELEDQMRNSTASSDYQFEALKRYLMLDSKDHYDGASIVAWFREVWAREFGRSASNEQLSALYAHLDSLFAQRPEPLPLELDANLVERTRDELVRIPVEQRAYGRIKRSPTGDIAGFSIARAAGPNAQLVFRRTSGASLNEAIEPIFSRAGYRQVFLPESAKVAARLLEEEWVLGERAAADAGLNDLAQRVLDLYYREFADKYEETLADLDLAPLSNPEQAASILRELSSQDSPLRKLVQAVRDETNLDILPESGPAGELEKKVSAAQTELASAIGEKPIGSAVNRTLQNRNVLHDRFARLQQLIPEKGPGPLDRILERLHELYEFMDTVAREQSRGGVPPNVTAQGEQTLQHLETEAKDNQPKFLENLVTSAGQQASDIAFGGVAAHLNNEWRGRPLQFCKEAIAGRYPVDKKSTRDVRLEDFAEFFGPAGIVERFFNDFLKPYVDTTSRPWHARQSKSNLIKLTDASLKQFERANMIKEIFFRSGAMPSVGFDMTPLQMDRNLSSFALDLDGQHISYSFGPRVSELLKWPGPNGPAEVRIEMSPPGPSGQRGITVSGPWAWFKVLDQAAMKPMDQPEHFRVDFSLDGRTVSYELTARSAFNPFRFSGLDEFECPPGV